ncbi:MAG: 30S ribosomal protein S6 [Acidimicrobiales bacterium]|nr:MAG: 30S ribosomal protein S6 [Acidimicrobiales bacterium]
MRPYEIMIILDASLEEESVRALVDRATELIRSGGGNPGSVNRWGRRRFAYELDHRWEGEYVLLEATAQPETMADLHRMLSLADEVLRHKVLRLPEDSGATAAHRSDGVGDRGEPIHERS